MIVRRADRVFWRGAPGLVVLADSDGSMTEVSGPGREVWEALAEPIDDRELAARLARNHDGEADEIFADVSALLTGLIERGLVVGDV